MKLEMRAKLAQQELDRRRNQLDHEIKWVENTLMELRAAYERKDDFLLDSNVAERLVNAAGRVSDGVGRVRSALTLVIALDQIKEEQA